MADIKTYTLEEVRAMLDFRNEHPDNLETDQDGFGQLVIYTDIYRWEDGSYHDESEDDQEGYQR